MDAREVEVGVTADDAQDLAYANRLKPARFACIAHQ
jgi:hypothetical protein